MATRAHSGTWIAPGVHKAIWTGLLNGDDGDALDAPMLPDKTVYISGTLGVGGSISIKGTNVRPNPAIASMPILNDPQANPLTFTAIDKVEAILENPQDIRPHVTAGDGSTSFTVTIVSRANK